MSESTAIRTRRRTRVTLCQGCEKRTSKEHYHALHFVQNRWLVTDGHYSCRPGACESADEREGIR